MSWLVSKIKGILCMYKKGEQLPVSFKETTKPGSLENYSELWGQCFIRQDRFQEVTKIAQKAVVNIDRYKLIEAKLGLPWYLVAALHNMESGMDFNKGLHCGQPWNKKTTLEPKGRGPFDSWEAAALDALRIKNVQYISRSSWTIPFCLQFAEKYNGLGYLKWHPRDKSPYLWAATSINDGTGKYIGDGTYKDDADSDSQVGVAALIRYFVHIGIIQEEQKEVLT